MNTQPSTIRHGELVHKLVLDRRTAEEFGRIDYLWLIPQTHRVVGFTCKSGLFGGRKRSFTWGQIESIGADSIMVNFNANDFADPQKPEEAFSLIGHEVWTEAGNKAGKVVDYLFVPETGGVVNYLFVSNGWQGILNVAYLLDLSDITSIGSKRLIVKNAAVEGAKQYGSWQEKINQVTEVLKEDYKKTQADLEVFKRGAQDMAGRVKDKAQDIAEQLKERPEEIERESVALPPAREVIEFKAEVIREDREEKEK